MAPKARSEPPEALLARVRGLCLLLPHAVEATSHGNPAFKLGKATFAVLDHYRGGFCLWLLCPAESREEALARAGWFPSPYDPEARAVCGDIEAIDWAEAEAMVRDSYRLAGGA